MMVRATFAANHHTHFMLLANLPTFEELAKLFGGNDPLCRLTLYDETSANYNIRWK